MQHLFWSDCEYKGKGAGWTECDPITSRRVLVKELEEGSPESCPPTHIKVRRCKKGSRSRASVDRIRRKKERKEARKEARKERKKAKKDRKGRKGKMRKQRRMRKGKGKLSSSEPYILISYGQSSRA